nr:Sulfite reductase [NADPH] hemoprotein beta-component [Klebsiella pneumoniae]
MSCALSAVISEMSTNERKHPGPLVVEGKLSDAERMKLESNYLRGTIAEDLNDGLTGGFKGDNFLLIRFHGMYQQDDRDIRAERAAQKLEPRHAMLLRCRLPGGVITTTQWKAIDKFAAENTIYGSIRLTNRQTFQFHGILKRTSSRCIRCCTRWGWTRWPPPTI